jgi:hypothetical protein
MRLKLTLAVGLLVGAAVLGITLSRRPLTVARVSTARRTLIDVLHRKTVACQPNEVLPRGTSAIRLRAESFLGPRVTVEVLEHGRVITHGERGSGWTGTVVTVPVKPLPTTRSAVELCFALLLNGDEFDTLAGEVTTGARAARGVRGPLPGRERVEDLRAADSSWWSLAPAVARRMGLGHAWGGTWCVPVVIVLMAGVVLLCSLAILRGLGVRPAAADSRARAQVGRTRGRRRPLDALRGVPTLAWLCAVVACVNAVCWSVITPPFQVPDEPEHVAYVKQLAETGRLPAHTEELSAEEEVALRDLRLQTVEDAPEEHTISTRAEQQKLERDLVLAERSPRLGGEGAGVAASQPPLYYALEAIPYTLGESGTLLDRVELMRLLSAVMGGLTALFTFLFVREALPRERWAWIVGGLGVALAPLLGFMSGAVNPDAMLYAVTAALFYCLARSFRAGLTRTRAVALGALIATGLLAKLNFIGLAPGALLGLIVLSIRARRTQGRAACVSLALALALAVSPAVVYVAAHVASGAPAFGILAGAVAATHGSPLSELSYIWQLYLPRLPGMRADFAGVLTTQAIWFNGYVGLYGWLDTQFPAWVYDLAVVPAAVILGLCVRSVVSASALRARMSELVVYAAMCAGLLVLIGADSYLVFPTIDAEYGQARYLLPLLPLLGLVLALAARGAGRRWGTAVGAAMIMLLLWHDIFSQLQEVARFYG